MKPDVRSRLLKSLQEAMRQGKGTMMVYDYDDDNVRFYSRHLMCPTSGIAFNEPAPHSFSVNSAARGLPHCNGLGEEAVFDMERIVPDGGKSIRDGGVEPLGRYRNNLLFAELEALGRKYDFTIDDPIESLNEEALNAVLYGDSEPLRIDARELGGTGNYMVSWEGVADYIEKQRDEFCVQQRGQMEGTIRRPARMQRLRRQPATQGSALFQNRRKKHRRIVGAQYRGIRPLDGRHRKTPFEKTGADRTRNPERDPRTTSFSAGRRTGLPVAEPQFAFAVRRGEPADPTGDSDRVETGQRALHPRRTEHRIASARQYQTDQQSEGCATRGIR